MLHLAPPYLGWCVVSRAAMCYLVAAVFSLRVTERAYRYRAAPISLLRSMVMDGASVTLTSASVHA